MALKPRKTPFTCETVEAIAAGVAADPNAPTGEWVVRMGSVWRSQHDVVIAHPQWFVPLGDGQTAPKYWPGAQDAE